NSRIASRGYEVADLGNVHADQAETAPAGNAHAKYLLQIASACSLLAMKVEEALGHGQLPLVLGVDRSVAVGTASGVSHHFRSRNESIGMIWLDAHADMNTPESSPSGNVHGMPLACIAGLGPAELVDLFGYRPKVAPRNIVIVGLRDVDQMEK